MEKVTQEFNEIPEFQQITILGDPGCDGLGAATMSIFARALVSLPSDFTVIVGDIVHRGIPVLYKSMNDFVDRISPRPVYMLCGNHDQAHYGEFFGFRNYALYNKKSLLLFLDDSHRRFERDTLHFLDKALREYQRPDVVLFMHIPPPNNIGSNTLPRDEWDKILALLRQHSVLPRFVICGHVHSYYEDQIDGMQLRVTGGAGARLEFVSDQVDTSKAQHHVLKLHYGSQGELLLGHVHLQNIVYEHELQDPQLKGFLENAFAGESQAHIRYRIYAEDAAERGYAGLAHLFRALADAEFHHARNHFYALGGMRSVEEYVRTSLAAENYEIELMYQEYLQYAEEHNQGLAAYSFHDAREAEKMHAHLLEKAADFLHNGQDIADTAYYTCTSCGHTFSGEVHPLHCPICGAPADKIHLVP